MMNNVKKFKNGNVRIYSDNGEYYKGIDDLYNHEITMNDLYFNQINGYMYLIDFNTNNVYDFSQCYINILEYLENMMKGKKFINLYPLPKKEAKSILSDLEGEYWYDDTWKDRKIFHCISGTGER